jgi:hypothetical protein
VTLRSLTAVVAAALSVPSFAAAREGDDHPARDVARVVEIRVSGDAAAIARVRVTARELLRRLDVQPNVKAIDEPETRSDEPQPLVIAHVDLLRPSAPSIDIEDGASHQELTRRTLNDVSSLETGVEGVLHVLYLAVESRLQVGLKPEPPPAPAAAPARAGDGMPKRPAPPAPKREQVSSSYGLDVGPLFRLSSLGGSRIVPGGGVALEPRVQVGRGFASLLLSGTVHGTTELAFDRGSAEVRPLQARIVPTLDWPISSDVSGCMGVGAGLDSFKLSPTQAPEQGVARPAPASIDPVLTGLVGARVPIAGRMFLAAQASLDLDLAPTAFVAREGETTHSILQLPRLRAGLSLALSFTVAGSRRFSARAVEQ